MYASMSVLMVAVVLISTGGMPVPAEAGVISNSAMKSAVSRAAASKQTTRNMKNPEAARGNVSEGLKAKIRAEEEVAINPIKPAQVSISQQRHPETAAHIREAQRLGQPAVLTLDRSGADARRKEALSNVNRKHDYPISGKDRDEYPPAMFREGGFNSDVRYVGAGDNRGAGKSIEQQLRDHPDGTKVRVHIVD